MHVIKQKLALLVLAAAVLVGGSAFALLGDVQAEKTSTLYYYILKTNGDPFVESDYTVREEQAPMPCGGDSEVCWIVAEDNGNGEPEITPALEAEIEEALTVTFEDSDHVKLRN
jgi:hypothetical protein